MGHSDRNARYTVRATDTLGRTVVEVHGDTRDAALSAVGKVIPTLAGRVERVESFREERWTGVWSRRD